MIWNKVVFRKAVIKVVDEAMIKVENKTVVKLEKKAVIIELVMQNKAIFKKAVIKVAVLQVEDKAVVEVEDEAVTKTGDEVIKAEDKVIMLDNTVVKMGDKETIMAIAQEMTICGCGTQKLIVSLYLLYQPLWVACLVPKVKLLVLEASWNVFYCFYPVNFMMKYSCRAICMQINKKMPKNDTSPWNPITKEELLAFIGVNLAMGVVQLPLADDYWSIDPILARPKPC